MGKTSHKCFKDLGQYIKFDKVDSTTKRRGQTHQKDKLALEIQEQGIKGKSARSSGEIGFDSCGVGKERIEDDSDRRAH